MAHAGSMERSSPGARVAASTHHCGDLGWWLFCRRTSIPVPLALLIGGVRAGEVWSRWPLLIGAFSIASGEIVRFWAVRHIGGISRTRTMRLGRLVTTGPYARTRNPLYVGNGLLWSGFVLVSGLLWMLPIALALFAVQHTAIVRWEETRLLERYPRAYRAYLDRVPRWWPTGPGDDGHRSIRYSWAQVAFSERGSVAAIIALTAVLVIKRLLR